MMPQFYLGSLGVETVGKGDPLENQVRLAC